MRRFKNSDGKPSDSITFAWISFIWCLSALTIGLVKELQIGDSIFKFRMLDATVVMALLTPSFGLYGFRRWLDKKFDGSKKSEDEEDLKKS